MTQTRAKIMQNPSFSYPVSGIYKVPPETPPHPLKESPRNFGHQKCSKCLKNAVQRRKKSWGWTDAQALVAPNHLRPNLGNLGIFHHRRPPKTIGFHLPMEGGKAPHDPYDLPSIFIKVRCRRPSGRVRFHHPPVPHVKHPVAGLVQWVPHWTHTVEIAGSSPGLITFSAAGDFTPLPLYRTSGHVLSSGISPVGSTLDVHCWGFGF